MPKQKQRVDDEGVDPPNGCLAKRIGVAIVGGTITLIGVALIVLPGPAIVVIPLGLSILATQFKWARRLLRKARQYATRAKEKVFARGSTGHPADAD